MTFRSLFPQPDIDLDPRVASVFRSLCARIEPTDIPPIKRQIVAHCEMIRAELRRNEFLDVDLAEQIAGVILVLLEEYEQLPEERQLLIIGATNYFIRPDDADPDVNSILGFDDDVAVLNYVLARIGRMDLRLEL